ncbi:universal stress protein [Pedosphaera parvula]|uniref:UspA domain protein n=1 Tax=Pedosphaera parvula (strain Ellin514) TaxID=320771 RepID=B9XBH8_PEDPL|nr:universal stress protein [Pedosphaera parvula]EEF62863.1 UspA domain protein [Pedosphaera parvula Ellin514]
MKVKPTSKPGQVVMELNRRDEKLLDRSFAEAQGPGWPFQLKNIMVPVDFSEFSKRALEYALPLAEKFGAKIILVHVIEPTFYPDNVMIPAETEEVNAIMASEGRKMLDQLGAEKIKSGIDSQKIITTGRPYNEIIQAAASQHADLIIMATHGYTGLKHMFMGSTAERVVRHAPCPVLVVRERRHETQG